MTSGIIHTFRRR